MHIFRVLGFLFGRGNLFLRVEQVAFANRSMRVLGSPVQNVAALTVNWTRFIRAHRCCMKAKHRTHKKEILLGGFELGWFSLV